VNLLATCPTSASAVFRARGHRDSRAAQEAIPTPQGLQKRSLPEATPSANERTRAHVGLEARRSRRSGWQELSRTVSLGTDSLPGALAKMAKGTRNGTSAVSDVNER
jgi:hypothetical protein